MALTMEAEEIKEQVNHPEHYNIEGRKECIDEMIDEFGIQATILWCLMTVKKYQYRVGKKEGNSIEQDCRKAMWYARKANELKARGELLDEQNRTDASTIR